MSKSTTSDALEIAEDLDRMYDNLDPGYGWQSLIERSSDELRRQHAEIEMLRAELDALRKQEPVAAMLVHSDGYEEPADIDALSAHLAPGQFAYPLYAAPVPASMPDAITVSMAPNSQYAKGWSDCRKQMFPSSTQQFEHGPTNPWPTAPKQADNGDSSHKGKGQES